jgi:hypothetical protein
MGGPNQEEWDARGMRHVWRGEFHTGNGGKIREKEENFVDLGVNGRIILKWLLKQDRGMQ